MCNPISMVQLADTILSWCSRGIQRWRASIGRTTEQSWTEYSLRSLPLFPGIIKTPPHPVAHTVLLIFALSCSDRGSPEQADFWNFFQRYRQFQSRRPRSKREREGEWEEGPKSPRFGLPRDYDRSYRISLSVVTPDLAYRLRRVQERREDEGRQGQEPCLILVANRRPYNLHSDVF